MRIRIPLLALALLFPLTGCYRSYREFGEFRDFSPSDGDYTILMPGKPTRDVNNGYGGPIIGYSVERVWGGYTVAASDFPPGTQLDLVRGIEGLAQKVGGTYRIEGNNLSEWCDFEIEGGDPRRSYAGRAVIAHSRLYLFYAFGNGDGTKLTNPDARKFIDSFRLNSGHTPGPVAASTNPAPQTGGMPQSRPPVAPPLPIRPGATPPPPAPPTPPAPVSPAPIKDGIVSMTADPTFREEAPAGGLLVGLDVWYGTYADYDIITAVRAIYRTDGGDSSGRTHGTETARGARVMAKPGYAVGSVVVRYGAAIDSLTVTFMKVVGGRLNAGDAYTAETVGGPNGHGPTKVGDGNLVTGITGRKGTNLTGFGLVFAAGK